MIVFLAVQKWIITKSKEIKKPVSYDRNMVQNQLRVKVIINLSFTHFKVLKFCFRTDTVKTEKAWSMNDSRKYSK